MSLSNKIDFVLLFDVLDGNPNGDPDAGNLPRTDPETGHGIVTDVALKRKIRNYVELARPSTQEGNDQAAANARYKIYVREGGILNKQHERAYTTLGFDLKDDGKGTRKGGDKVSEARAWMCANFFDVRTFGAVMSTEVNCGQVRGPVQITFARSVTPVLSARFTITRMAVTNERDAKKQQGDNRTMGPKYTVPYGLYVAHGFISAPLAEQTGFNEEDLSLLLEALQNMFEHDRSAARGRMATRGLYVFKHQSRMGNDHAHKLFERIQVRLKEGVEAPRSFEDYTVSINREGLKAEVELIELVD